MMEGVFGFQGFLAAPVRGHGGKVSFCNTLYKKEKNL